MYHDTRNHLAYKGRNSSNDDNGKLDSFYCETHRPSPFPALIVSRKAREKPLADAFATRASLRRDGLRPASTGNRRNVECATMQFWSIPNSAANLRWTEGAFTLVTFAAMQICDKCKMFRASSCTYFFFVLSLRVFYSCSIEIIWYYFNILFQ